MATFPSLYATKILSMHDFILNRWIMINRWIFMKAARQTNSPVLYQIMNERVHKNDNLYRTSSNKRKNGKDYIFRVVALKRSLAYTINNLYIDQCIMIDKDRIQIMLDRIAIRRVYVFLRSWSIYFRSRKTLGPKVWNGTVNKYFSGNHFNSIYQCTRNETVPVIQGESDRQKIDILHYCMMLHPISLAILISSINVVTFDFIFYAVRFNIRNSITFCYKSILSSFWGRRLQRLWS